jgi:hypothetical protein
MLLRLGDDIQLVVEARIASWLAAGWSSAHQAVARVRQYGRVASGVLQWRRLLYLEIRTAAKDYLHRPMGMKVSTMKIWLPMEVLGVSWAIRM